MRLLAKTTELNVVELFLHDSASWFPFSDEAVAQALTEAAKEHTKAGENFKAIAPGDNGLGRFTLSWMPNVRTAHKHFTKRVHTPEELEQMIGGRPMSILLAMEAQDIALDSD